MPDELAPMEGILRTVDVAYRRLRRAITRHEFAPGQHLSVPALARQLGVSRSPVREALQRLVAEGLAVEVPRKGIYVTRYEAADLLPSYEMRLALEGLAGRLAARRASDAQIEAIRGILEAGGAAIERDDLEAHIQQDIAFHTAIMDASGNPKLIEVLGGIYGRLHSAMTARVVLVGPRQAHEDHRRVFEALRARDPAATEAAARRHVERILERLVANGGER